MEFKDFKIDQFFWYEDRVFRVKALVHAIGAIEAIGNDGIAYYFDYLHYKKCRAVELHET